MKIIRFSLFFLFICASQIVNAVPENQVLNFVSNKLIEDQLSHRSFFISPVKDSGKKKKIYYSRFGKDKGSKGSIVIAPGRTESSIKYLEVAFDFIKMGYSPIYVIDHRGQGFSDRLLEDKRIGHVSNWDDYIEDFRYFVDHIVLKDKNISQENLSLITNSMGGAIALRYFQLYDDHPFKRAALSGAMLGIKYKKENDFTVFLKTHLICSGLVKSYRGKKLGCQTMAPGEKYFNWENRNFNQTLLTHSHARFKMRDLLWKKWKELEVGGPTVEWVKEANKVIYKITRKHDLNKIKIPILLLTAVEDFRAREQGHAKVCQRLGGNCTRLRYIDAYHELFMEIDRYRNHVMNSIDIFFQVRSISEFENKPEIQTFLAND